MNKSSGILFKLIVVGDIACGKTSYLRRLTSTEPNFTLGSYKATIGVDFLRKELPNRWNGENVATYIWDIAGDISGVVVVVF